MIFENSQFYFFWKPAGVPSTWGSGNCFLDAFDKGGYTPFTENDLEDSLWLELFKYFLEYTKELWLTKVEDVYGTISLLLHIFSQDQEYGLVNRLDTDTTGFLYFAKNQEVYANYISLQRKGKINKHYFAKVTWNIGRILQNGIKDDTHISIDKDTIIITYPIMHHRHLDDRMIIIKDPKDVEKWRGKMHLATTKCRVISYDIESNTSLIHTLITKWYRHQIRLHLAWFGYPIVGEGLYAKKDDEFGRLCLWSVGMKIVEE